MGGMATADGLLAEIVNYASAAAAAIGAGDYDTAMTRILQAEAALIGVPAEAAKDGEMVRIERRLESLKRSIEQSRAAAAGGMQSTRVRYVRTAED